MSDRTSPDLEDRLRGYAVPDVARPPQLVGDVGYVAHETPVGRLLLAARRTHRTTRRRTRS